MPRTGLALALAPLAGLSGCLTGELWRGYAWPEPVVTEHLVARQSRQIPGTLVESPPVLENGLWWGEDGDATPGRWWLRPEAGTGTGAELAAALFADPEFCVVQAAAIEAVCRQVDGEVVGDEAMLELDVRLDYGAIGQAVPATEVSPAAAQVLATVRRNAYVLAVDPGTFLPAVFRSCAARLAAVDLRRVAGEPLAVQVEAWVFVDADGRTAFRGDDDAEAEAAPAAADDEDAPLAARLAALRERSLLVRVRSGSRSTILRLRPDRLWLLAGLHIDGERCLHRSRWNLQAMPRFLAMPPAGDAPRVVATLRLQEEQWQRSVHPVLLDGDLLVKVALTPVTLALDLVLGPGVGDFLRWISGKGPKPEQRQGRGS